MSVECSTCGSDTISKDNFCVNCGSVVCHVCGSEGSDGWDEPHRENGEWVSYCKDCGTEIRSSHNPFAE